MIVDDDQTLCDMYAERLKAEGLEVIIAKNGEEGVAKATQYLPDVILLDIMMPKVNGFNALEILKSTEQTKNIPVFLLTALIQEENKKRGLQSGAEDYIIKSETMPGAIIEKIKAAIAKKANPAAGQGQPVAGSQPPSQPEDGSQMPEENTNSPESRSQMSEVNTGASQNNVPPVAMSAPASGNISSPPLPVNPPVTANENPTTPPEQNASTTGTPAV